MMADAPSTNEPPNPSQDTGMSTDTPTTTPPAEIVEPAPDAGGETETAVPAVEVPAVEVPAVEAPAVEAPPVEAPPVEAPPAEAPPVEVKPVEVPTAEVAPSEVTSTKAAVEEPADSDDGDEKPFDPATDLPMYRDGMDWFVLRVASNKENYVRETLMRKVQIEGLVARVGRIMVPTEKTKTLKGGKARITETKLYPGYIFVEMKLESDGRIPQDVFFLIKETTGVGDFVGTAGRPTPMAVHEVEKMLFDSRRPEETPTVKMEFAPGDFVTITEGPFESYEGTVDEVLPDKGLVRVLVTIFGRQAPIELEYWQIQKAD